MISLQTFLRRTAATAGAIAALMVMGPATSQTVTLSTGGSCPYSDMRVLPNGNVTVTCGGAVSSGPGTFSVVAPAQLAFGASSGTAVHVTRSGGTAGPANVAYNIASPTASCTPGSGTVTFPDLSATNQAIVVQALSVAGTCTVSITPPAGTAGSPTTTSINIVNPEAPVTFAFASTSLVSASVGGSPVNLTVTRTGGTANSFTVPFTLSGSLTTSGALLAGSLSPTGSLIFPANTSSQTLSYLPPSSSPASPGLPATFSILLGQANSATATPTQTATSNTTPAQVRLTGPVAGCPVATTAGTLGSIGYVNDVRLSSGEIGTFELPALGGVSTMANIGFFITAQSTPNTDNGGFFSIEMHINKCKGLVQPSTASKCYGVITNPVGGEIKWLKAFTTKYSSEAIATTAGYCYAPASEGPWYFNIRYNYPQGCGGNSKCGWHVVWRPLN